MRRSARGEVAPLWLQRIAALAAGVVAGLLAGLSQPPLVAALVGWDMTAAVYLAGAWLTIARLDSAATARLAVRQDPNRALADALLLVACLASLLAVAIVVGTASSSPGMDKTLHVALGVVSVLLSWMVVHTVFTTRYARLYYTGPDGGLDFHQPDPPCYADFAYTAFTVGITFQVSDTNVSTREMRAAVLRHALVSYLFGAVIIAGTINLIAGLAR
ncbi:Uncharacterized membrane protein [Micromonospora pattaloongensis]|uniref:Uncharacterized membrane protein n=1 Tax=Micromonospora pattaloongensis TaxID=405436 RepID=A0A1H3RUV3_9ACTN|nr:DUF1345 domain-containing protein [Micromonospora pattaloongensis]SDZ28709.1 Uncharacterized membrane protein [Micromonospora pattaloongensis]